MKRNFVAALFILLGIGICLQTGCWFQHDGNPVSPVSDSSTLVSTTVGNTASVQFKIVLPGSQVPSAVIRLGEGSVLPAIFADASATPIVTCKLILVNVGNASQPTTTLSKTVPVDASGTASFSFNGVPALTCIGDLHIEGGKIATWSDFHGVSDLVASGASLLEVSPVGQEQLPDVLASVFLRILGNEALFLKVTDGFGQWMTLALMGLPANTANLSDVAFSVISQRLVSGSPLPTQPEVIKVALPSGSGLKTADLRLASMFEEAIPLSNDGATLHPIQVDASRPANIAFCENADRKPVLLKVVRSDGAGSESPMSASSTAEALVLYDPLFLGLDGTAFAKVQSAAKSHSRFPELVGMVENAIRANPSDPWPQAPASLFELAAIITTDAWLTGIGSATPSIRYSVQSSIVGVQDDNAGTSQEGTKPTVELFNHSYCYYDVTVMKNGLPFRAPNRDTFLVSRKVWDPVGVATDWAIEKLNPFSNTTFSNGNLIEPGDGKLEFTFKKEAALSYADGLVSFIFGILSIPSEGRAGEIEDLVKVADYLRTIIGSSGSLFSSNNRQEVYKNLVDLVIDVHAPLWGYLEEILTKRLTKVFNTVASNRVKFLLGLLSRKLAAPIAIFDAANLTIDLVLINQSHRNNPETFATQGAQWENKFPAIGVQNLKATPGNKEVALSWDALPKALKYRIYQKTSSGVKPEGSPVAEVSQTSKTISGLTNDQTYFFIVSGIGANGTKSPVSGEVSAKPARFIRNPDGIITDSLTNLQWLEGPDQPLTWNDVQNWLGLLGSGWSIPSREQLSGIYLSESSRQGGTSPDGVDGPYALHLDPAFIGDSSYRVWNASGSEAGWAYSFVSPGDARYGPSESIWFIRGFAVRPKR